MESRAKALGHAIHPLLIPFPLGLLATAVVFDIVYLITDRGGFAVAAAYMIAAGIIGGLLAAPFGWIDWFKIPAGTRAKSIGLTHSSATLRWSCCSQRAGWSALRTAGSRPRGRWCAASPRWCWRSEPHGWAGSSSSASASGSTKAQASTRRVR